MSGIRTSFRVNGRLVDTQFVGAGSYNLVYSYQDNEGNKRVFRIPQERVWVLVDGKPASLSSRKKAKDYKDYVNKIKEGSVVWGINDLNQGPGPRPHSLESTERLLRVFGEYPEQQSVLTPEKVTVTLQSGEKLSSAELFSATYLEAKEYRNATDVEVALTMLDLYIKKERFLLDGFAHGNVKVHKETGRVVIPDIDMAISPRRGSDASHAYASLGYFTHYNSYVTSFNEHDPLSAKVFNFFDQELRKAHNLKRRGIDEEVPKDQRIENAKQCLEEVLKAIPASNRDRDIDVRPIYAWLENFSREYEPSWAEQRITELREIEKTVTENRALRKGLDEKLKHIDTHYANGWAPLSFSSDQSRWEYLDKLESMLWLKKISPVVVAYMKRELDELRQMATELPIFNTHPKSRREWFLSLEINASTVEDVLTMGESLCEDPDCSPETEAFVRQRFVDSIDEIIPLIQNNSSAAQKLFDLVSPLKEERRDLHDKLKSLSRIMFDQDFKVLINKAPEQGFPMGSSRYKALDSFSKRYKDFTFSNDQERVKALYQFERLLSHRGGWFDSRSRSQEPFEFKKLKAEIAALRSLVTKNLQIPLITQSEIISSSPKELSKVASVLTFKKYLEDVKKSEVSNKDHPHPT
jgi:hypothetical protein